MARDIGIDVAPPAKSCDDPKCPFHGTLPVRGTQLKGRVVSSSERTVVVQREYLHFVHKYERYERRHSKIPAHNPPCMEAKVGSAVRIVECRPLSKTKRYVVVQVAGGGIGSADANRGGGIGSADANLL